MHAHHYEYTYANPYEHLRMTEHRQDLKILEVTTGASSSTGTSLTT
jgi:hypothetical protein